MAEPKLIKICLTNRGEDTETPWAAELGPAPNAPPNSLKVKLVNVPFMHAKPTWGDTIVVTPAADKVLTWDREGVPWKEIAKRIVEDGGRWAMIIDYAPHADAADAFTALGRACDAAKIVCEGAWGPREAEPGRAYLAVQKELTAEQVMEILAAAALPLDLTQIHPEPKKRAPVTRAGTVVGISDDAGRPPAKPARAKTEKPIEGDAPSRKSKPAMDSMRPGSRADLAAQVEAPPPAAKSEAANATVAAKSKAAAPVPAKAPAKASPAPKKSPAAKSAPAPAKPAAKSSSKPAAKPAASKKAPPAKALAKPAAKATPKKPAKKK